MNSIKLKTIGEDILKLIFRYRRLLQNTLSHSVEELPYPWLTSHMHKVEFFIKNEQPIHFILPAFPAKSPNPQKVLGTLPDMGEQISLQFLQSLCSQIREIYAPGARLTICSDGRVFSELVGVKDENVTAYSQALKNMLGEIGADAISLFKLEDVFGRISFDEMRQQLALHYAESLESIRARVKSDPSYRQLFNGIHRFLFEDYLVLQPSQSRSQLRAKCKELTYGLIQRSNAWSALITKQFPCALRLSIHPQPYHSEKIGIHMIKTLDEWGTPWHNAAVYDGEKFLLVKRSVLDSLGASLVWKNGRPSHFLWSDKSQPLSTVLQQRDVR